MGYRITRISETGVFRDWVDSLEDPRGRARILVRIDRLVHGNAGDHRHLKQGISELRIDEGPGYRVYYALRDGSLLLLAGGDKSTQSRDITRAERLARIFEA